jgi:hypothetical protein
MRSLIAYDSLRGLGSWRWLLVPLVFAVTMWLEIDSVEVDFSQQARRAVNVWDGPLSLLTNVPVLLFVFALGFLFVVGDLYIRQRADHTAAMTMLRMPSRLGWWIAKIGAVGVLALCYALLGMGAALLVSAMHLPWSWSPSGMARLPFDGVNSLYPRFADLPMAAFFGLTILYTAFVLWAIGAVTLTVSVLWPKAAVPFSFAAIWVSSETATGALSLPREGFCQLDPLYLLSYARHFAIVRNEHTVTLGMTSWSQSLTAIGAVIILMVTLGWIRLQRMDL